MEKLYSPFLCAKRKEKQVLKLRVDGSKQEIRRFLRVLSRIPLIEVYEESISDFKQTDKEGYYIIYLNIGCQCKSRRKVS